MRINRPAYLNTLIRWKDKEELIKVITGVRRCGKSTLFLLFQEYLKTQGVEDNQILSVNFEMADYASLLDYQALHAYILEHCVADKMNYVFLDEVQLVPQFQKAVNSLRLRKNIDLYITGSNAYMFSQKLTTLLAGRFIEVKMLPLSFKEYMSAFADLKEDSYDRKFEEYVTYGSFPQVLDLYRNGEFDRQAWHNYLESVYNTIIVKDIMARQGIKDLSKLERVIRFLFGNIGSESSLSNISNVLNADANSHIHVQTIEAYIEGLLDGYAFYKVLPNYLKGKRRLRSNAKYYAADTGLRYFLLGGNAGQDAGHVLENIVFLELNRRGYEVETGRSPEGEIDFVATMPGGKIEYYQVAQSVLDENTFKREIKPLQAIKDNYPKFILTRDYNTGNDNGIEIVNVLKWLMQG